MDPHEDMSLQEALFIIDNVGPRERTAHAGSHSNTLPSLDDQSFTQAVKSELRALNNGKKKTNNKMEHLDDKIDTLVVALTSSLNSMKVWTFFYVIVYGIYTTFGITFLAAIMIGKCLSIHPFVYGRAPP